MATRKPLENESLRGEAKIGLTMSTVYLKTYEWMPLKRNNLDLKVGYTFFTLLKSVGEKKICCNLSVFPSG